MLRKLVIPLITVSLVISGCATDPQQVALERLRDAEKGDPQAQDYTGIDYMNGYGVQQDYAVALKWLLKAATQTKNLSIQGDAQTLIGGLYRHGGPGLTRDSSLAMKWYLMAVGGGTDSTPYAENCIGEMYLNGEGVTKDYFKAMKWFLRAAAKGQGFADWNIATMYQRGLGVPQSEAEAEKWKLAGDAADAEGARKNAEKNDGNFGKFLRAWAATVEVAQEAMQQGDMIPSPSAVGTGTGAANTSGLTDEQLTNLCKQRCSSQINSCQSNSMGACYRAHGCMLRCAADNLPNNPSRAEWLRTAAEDDKDAAKISAVPYTLNFGNNAPPPVLHSTSANAGALSSDVCTEQERRARGCATQAARD